MTEEDRNKIVSQDYADLIIDYRSNSQLLNAFPGALFHIMNEAFAVIHIPVSQFTNQIIGQYGYSVIPAVFGLTSEASLEASGVTELKRLPNFNLRGEGVLIGIIDTGIDYTNPVFLKADGTTKINSIWDQTIPSESGYPFNTYFGTEYKAEQINQALGAANPLDLVPSRDENGHGTMLAAVAAGTEMAQNDFAGVAPDAELVIVKLLETKNYLRNFFGIPQNIVCFESNKIMWGVQYCIQVSRQANKPVVICIGVGTSQDSHDGHSALDDFINMVGDYKDVAVVVSAGNEGNRGRHYHGSIDPQIGYNTVELNVGENEEGFSMQLWGEAPGLYTIDILSPSGEYIPRLAAGLRVNREISFIFEETTINIDYLSVETETGDQLILLRFHNVSSGLWRFNVYGRGDLITGFHIWLPMGDMISNSTYFILPDIYTTVTSPGNTTIPITVTAYNPVSSTLYVNASRGYTRANTIKPDLAAPGVNYVAPNLNKEFVNFTGTGVAAAHTSGIAALIFEWGDVRGNQPDLDSLAIKKFLIRGAKRSENITYPNREWGFGMLDIYNTFNVLRENL
jgi:subtilisin family serine protease